MTQQSLKERLGILLQEEAKNLPSLYEELPEEKSHSIRARLNENVGTIFQRLSRGLYIATKGDTQAIIIEGDAWKKIKDFESNSFDTIITDSPYSSLNHHLAKGTTRKQTNKWEFETKDIDEELLKELFRVLKPNGHFFSFSPPDSKDTLEYNRTFLKKAMACGFEFNKQLIWDKQVFGMGYSFRNRYEQIYFLSKGKRRKGLNFSIPDVLSHKRIHAGKRIQEAEKPVELLKDLLKFSCKEGDIVFDPFGGSLSLAKACLESNIHSVSIEINKEFIEQALKQRNITTIKA